MATRPVSAYVTSQFIDKSAGFVMRLVAVSISQRLRGSGAYEYANVEANMKFLWTIMKGFLLTL